MHAVHKMRPIATDVTRSAWYVCLSVCLCAGHVDVLCKYGWTDRNAVRGTDSYDPKEPYNIHGVEIPHGKGQFWGIVQPTEKHWDWVIAEVYAAKRIIQFSIKARHAMRPFDKIVWPLVILFWSQIFLFGTGAIFLCFFVFRFQARSLRCSGRRKPRRPSITHLGSVQTSEPTLQTRHHASNRLSVLGDVVILNAKHISVPRKVHVYQTLLLYASETWTLLTSGTRTIESFQAFTWNVSGKSVEYDHVRNAEMSSLTGLPCVPPDLERLDWTPCSETSRDSQNNNVAHPATLRQVSPLFLGSSHDPTWKLQFGRRRRSRWIDQLRRDTDTPAANLWRRPTGRGGGDDDYD